jgi:hypothetical protein
MGLVIAFFPSCNRLANAFASPETLGTSTRPIAVLVSGARKANNGLGLPVRTFDRLFYRLSVLSAPLMDAASRIAAKAHVTALHGRYE